MEIETDGGTLRILKVLRNTDGVLHRPEPKLVPGTLILIAEYEENENGNSKSEAGAGADRSATVAGKTNGAKAQHPAQARKGNGKAEPVRYGQNLEGGSMND